MFYSFFVWCAGSDKDILEHCPAYERTRHVGYGTLVLIPSVVAFFTMSYAVFTMFPEQPRIFFSIAASWALIVFSIDRFILSSFRKSDSISRDLLTPAALVRIVFAAVLGIVVAHPVVMLVFQDSINQKLVAMKGDQVLEIRGKYESKIRAYEEKNRFLNEEIAEKNESLACLRRLLTLEQSGTKKELGCGASSGLPKFGTRAEEISKQISDVSRECSDLKKKNEGYIADNQKTIERLQTLQVQELDSFEQSYATGYPVRMMALAEIEREYPGTFAVTKWVLILFFVLLDVIAISLKVMTKSGHYDKAIAEDEGAPFENSRYAIWRKQVDEEDRQETALRSELVDELLEIRRKHFRKIVKEWEASGKGTIPDLLSKLKVIIGFRYLSSMFNDNPPVSVRFRNNVWKLHGKLIDWLNNLILGVIVGGSFVFIFLKTNNLSLAVVPLALYSVLQVVLEKTTKLFADQGMQ